MITLLMGENSYEVERALGQLIISFEGEAEKYDGSEVELRHLPDLLSGQTLFSERRFVVIRDPSASKPVWDGLPDFLERMSDDVHLVLIEPSPDKRTKTYKLLQKIADVKEFQLYGERDTRQVEKWLLGEAERLGMRVDAATAKALIGRSMVMTEKGQPVVDQWLLQHSLERLAVFDAVTVEVVEQYIDLQPIDSVFRVFETALKGDEKALHQLIADIAPKEDAFRVFGLLSGQVFQLAALRASDVSVAETAKAIGVHPYAASKLGSYAQKLSQKQVRSIVAAFAGADEAMKLSKAEPWLLIEQALMKTTKSIHDM